LAVRILAGAAGTFRFSLFDFRFYFSWPLGGSFPSAKIIKLNQPQKRKMVKKR